ncbi:MAG: lipid-A-disaccharide synthase N-terminal domain-containing protein, partial [Candidatus Omnitrophica bacterium]|nr:lipid-A-disaccharide synthase N-terminal domain-containing protein [Candidatus Omnitrophota bacterium]
MEMKYWVVIGFIGQMTFGGRFIVQWICSEKRQESHIPVVFWYLSIVGGTILLMYAISRKDPVF